MVYHLFGSAYGWTIGQVDDLTVPQVFAMMEQIRRYPPTNVILMEFFGGMGKGKETMKDKVVEDGLSRMPNVTDRVNEPSGIASEKRALPIQIHSRTGRPIRRVIVRKTGEEIISNGR